MIQADRRKSLLASVPPAIRMSAGALLLSERKTTIELRRDVVDASDRAAGELSRQHDKRNAAIMMLLLTTSHRLQGDLEQTLRLAKTRARETAARRLQVELRALGEAEAASKVVLTARWAADVQAQTTAEALALAWRQRAIYEVMKAEREETSVLEAVSSVAKGIDGNVTRAGATESAQAYSQGHAEAAEELSVVGVVDKWEAMLDACPRCRKLNGTTTPVGEPFPSGDEPGWVHPRCRCFRATVKAAK